MSGERPLRKESGSLTGASAIILVATLVGGVVSLLTSVAVAKLLTVSEFGMYSTLMLTAGIVSSIGAFGVPRAIAKIAAERNALDLREAMRISKTGLLIVLGITSASVSVYVMLGGVIGDILNVDSKFVYLVPFSAAVAFSSSLLAVMVGTAQGCQRFRVLAVAQVAVPCLCFAFVIPLAFDVGVSGVFIGFAAGQFLVVLIIALWLSNTGFPFLSKGVQTTISSETSRFFRFAALSFFSSLIVVPVLWFGNAELVAVEGFEAAGYFAVAYVFYSALALLPTAVQIPLLPKVSEMTVTSPREIEGAMISAVLGSGALIFPLSFAISMFSDVAAKIVYGSSYTDAWVVVYFMVFASYFYAMGSFSTTALMGMGKMREYLLLQIAWAVTFIALVLILIPGFGASGLAVTFVISYAVLYVLAALAARRQLKLNMFPTFVPTLVSGVFFILGFVVISEMRGGFASRLVLLSLGSFIALWRVRRSIRLLVRRAISSEL